jgi:hypothetical protein
MKAITAMLVALTLAGSPVSSVVCAMVCGHSTTPAAHCHEHMTDHAADVAIAADIACGSLLADAPFVKENITLPLATVDATATYAFTPSLLVVTHPSSEHAAATWLKPPLILRL